MAQPDHHCHHHQLWVGYALIVVVIVLLVLAVNSAMQAKQLRRKTMDLDGRITTLKSEHKQASALLADQMHENQLQDAALAQQKRRLRRQELAIGRLAHLRKMDADALTSLHNDLAATHSNDAQVRKRLIQLEHSNVAARATLNAAGQPEQSKP